MPFDREDDIAIVERKRWKKKAESEASQDIFSEITLNDECRLRLEKKNR